ncbi:MAG: SPOR domain-containing protein, partial [Myxococcota bacterium]
RATPGRTEEIIGGPAPEARGPGGADVTSQVLAEGAVPASQQQAKVAAVAPEPPPPPPSDGGNFTVQVAAFSERARAETLAEKLRGKRYDVFLTSAVTEEGGVLHRVRVGRFKSDDDASRVASKLAKDYRDEGAVPFVVNLEP